MTNFYESAVFNNLPDKSMHPGGLRLTDRAARLAALCEGMRVADIGCGSGVTAAFLKEKYKLSVVGLELSDVLVDMGLKNHPGLGLIRWNCESLPFENESLDAVIFECSLSVIGNTKRILSASAGALKRNGSLIISDVYSKQTKRDELSSPLTQDKLMELLVGAGFNVVHHEDHTAALRTYIAELKENNGAEFDAGMFFGASCNMGCMRLSDFGYALIIARKI